MKRIRLLDNFKDIVSVVERQNVIQDTFDQISKVFAAEDKEKKDIYEEVCEILRDYRDVVRLYAEFEKH